MERTRTTDPVDSLCSGQSMCVEFIRVTRLFLMENVAYVITRTVLLSLSSGSRHCCDSLSTTFQPATISQQNNKISTTIQHRSQQSNTVITIQTQYSALFFKGTILHRLGLYFTLLAFPPEGFKPELITSPCHLFDSGEIFLGSDSVS